MFYLLRGVYDVWLLFRDDREILGFFCWSSGVVLERIMRTELFVGRGSGRGSRRGRAV